MTRATQTLSFLCALVAMWLSLLLGYVPIQDKTRQDVVPYLPVWAVVTFGAYLLAKLGYGLATFNDVPEAHKELMAQIDLAKKELRSKGVDVD